MILTTEAREKLGNDEVKMRICLDLGISYITFRRWIKDAEVHENFTKTKSLEVIKKHTGLADDQLFEAELSN